MGEKRKTFRDYLMFGGVNGILFHSVRPGLGRPYRVKKIISSDKVEVEFMGSGVTPKTRTIDNCLDNLEVNIEDKGFIKYM